MSRRSLILLFLVGVTAAAVLFSLLLGGSRLTVGEIVAGLAHPGSGSMSAVILWHIRLPRILLGLIVGMGLAVSGSVFQGVLRNPLAEPYTLGISGGAAFGATLCTVSGLAGVSLFFTPLGAYAGALFGIALVYGAASRRDFSESTLILSGVMLGVLFSSLVLFLFAVVDSQRMHAAAFWLMGDLSSTDPRVIAIAFSMIVPGVIFLSSYGREIDLLSLGDEKAAHLGLRPQRTRKVLFVVASLVTAACVSASGIIGFVGLIVPHAMRRIAGPAHGLLVPASGLAGASFLILCDAAARSMISPAEFPVGVITGIAGGLFFLDLIFRTGKRAF